MVFTHRNDAEQVVALQEKVWVKALDVGGCFIPSIAPTLVITVVGFWMVLECFGLGNLWFNMGENWMTSPRARSSERRLPQPSIFS